MNKNARTRMYSGAGCLAFFGAGIFHASAESVEEIVHRLQDQDPGQEMVQDPRQLNLPDGTRAVTCVFRHTTWELKNPPQSMVAGSDLEAQALAKSVAERLKVMNRYQDHMQLWLVPLKTVPKANGDLKRFLKPEPLTHRYHREVAWLGQGHGYAWYGYMPIYHWTYLRKEMGLQGGEDTLAAAARGLAVEDHGGMTANSAESWLVQAGAKAIPYLTTAMTASYYRRALRVLGGIKELSAGQMLMEHFRSGKPEIAKAARHTLIHNVRSEAESLYFEWLEADAGHVSVGPLLRTCAKVNKPRLKSLLPLILAAPKTHREFRYAFELSRELSARGIAKKLLEAETAIKHYGYRSGKNFDAAKVNKAAAVLIESKDVEAAAHIALSLACATTKGDWNAVNVAGISVLKQLPANQGRALARTLVASSEEDWIKRKLLAMDP